MTPVVSAEHRRAMRPRVARHVRPLVAGLLGVVGVAASFVSVDGAMLEWIGLALLVPVVAWCAVPLHRAALRGIARRRLTTQVLASVGIVVAFAWSAWALATDHSAGHLVPVALASLLLIIAQHVCGLAGHDEAEDPAPGWLPPLVLGISVGALIVWTLIDGFAAGASAGVAVLLGSTPAALLLAKPAALVVSARRGEEIGVRAADVDAMRAASRIDTIVLDKDGTVTTGELSVMSVDPVESDHLRNLRWFAGALAHSSDHPVARAISKLAPRGRVSNVVNLPTQGLSGAVDRHPVRIGLSGWLGVEDVGGLGTQVAVEVDGRSLGWITVGDTVRVGARQGVERLDALGLDPILVSERPEADTTHLAGQAGIATHYPRMTVDGCVALVRRLQAEGRIVAVVGALGGHAPALRAADLAISTVGEVPRGGVSLADVDVQRVGDAIVLMRSTLATILANRRWAVIGMLIPMPFAAAGLIAPWFAPLFGLAGVLGVAVSASRIPRGQRSAADRRA